MGLLYCGANTASRQPSLVVSGGNFPNSMQHFEGLSASELCALSRWSDNKLVWSLGPRQWTLCSVGVAGGQWLSSQYLSRDQPAAAATQLKTSMNSDWVTVCCCVWSRQNIKLLFSLARQWLSPVSCQPISLTLFNRGRERKADPFKKVWNFFRFLKVHSFEACWLVRSKN